MSSRQPPVLILACLTFGCASQGPPPDPRERYVNAQGSDDQVAVIKDTHAGNFLFPYYAEVIEVDGKAPAKNLRVTPGRHELVVNAAPNGQVVVVTTFQFDFLAGHVYRIDRIGTFDQRPKVIDETTTKQYPIYAKQK